MKIGLIARSENRGLGNLTWEWAQHMDPTRVLVIVPNHPIAQRPERYDRFDRMTLAWDHHGDSRLNETGVRAWLDGLDVVYSAETFYDWRMCDWAREQGVRTVCHVMPEYYRHATTPGLSRPDAWWTPTHWRLGTLDQATRVVPVPIATERFQRRPEWSSQRASAGTRDELAKGTAPSVTPEPSGSSEHEPNRRPSSDVDRPAGRTPTSISDAASSPANPASDAADQQKCTTTTTTDRSTSAGSADLITSPSMVRRETSALRSLHVGGKAAAADRNGTRILVRSLRHLVREHDVSIRTQGDRIPHGQLGPKVTLRTTIEEAGEYWEMYGDADMLVLPRRYAGLSLPVLEAMAAGLAIVMTDCEPQASEWPISPLPAQALGFVRTGAGRIPLAEVLPRALAARMDWLADHPDEVASLQRASRAFADAHSWERLQPVIVDELERVLS